MYNSQHTFSATYKPMAFNTYYSLLSSLFYYMYVLLVAVSQVNLVYR